MRKQTQKRKKPFSEAEWEEPAALLRAIASPTRLLILQVLCSSCTCIKDLNTLIPVSQPRLSQHMAVLKKANLVESHHSQSLRCYYVTRPTLVRKLIRLLSEEHPIKLRERQKVIHEAKSDAGKSRRKAGRC